MESVALSVHGGVLAVQGRAVSIYTTGAPLGPFAGGGLISAILRRQSASESCGPETNVPLTLVEYQPDTTPSRSDSSVLTWRGERLCMWMLSDLDVRPLRRTKTVGVHRQRVTICARHSHPRAGQSPP